MKQYKNEKSIAILMATYNGAKYLQEQINSILNQEYTDFTLYIRDDCSTDNTLDILDKYKHLQNIVIIIGDKNLGSNRSFLYLLEIVQSNYYMFADQDDVWLPFKVKKSYDVLKKEEIKGGEVVPTIVHTDLHLVDSTLNTIASSYWKFCCIGVNYPNTFDMCCHYNDVTGCAMIFNKEVKKLYMPYEGIELRHKTYHDGFLKLLVVQAGGRIVPLHEQTILFRRHGKNSTDPLSKKNGILNTPWKVVSYIKEMYARYKYCSKFGNTTFVKFLYYKVITKFYQKRWIKKQEL